MIRTYTDGTVEYLDDNCKICGNSSTARCEHCRVTIAPDGQVWQSLKRSLVENAGIWKRLADAG